MEKQREQDRADLEVKRLCGVFGSPQPPEEEKKLLTENPKYACIFEQ